MSTSALDYSYYDSVSSITSDSATSDLDKEAFLLLLITQFQNQDPLDPMDDTDFIAQLAQFSTLEQMMTINESMESIIYSTDAQTTIAITSYIGKEVSGRGLGVSKDGDTISLVQYAASEEMASCYVNILDSNSSVIASIDLGSRASGIHEFTWDGLTNTGSEAPDGIYTASFSGTNASGDFVYVDTSVSGLVAGTAYYDGVYYLRLSDGRSLSLDSVREVVAAGYYDDDTEEEVETGTSYVGSSGDDYLEGTAGVADTIEGNGGNDIIVYDSVDTSVDGGDGYDVLIATETIGDNATNFEAVVRGTNASNVTSFSYLENLGLTLSDDGTYVDTTSATWLANWTDAGDDQWTYTGGGDDDNLITITLYGQPDEDDTSTTASLDNADDIVTVADATGFGLDSDVTPIATPASYSLSTNTSETITRLMQAISA